MQEVKYCQRCGVVIGDAYNTDWYAYISQKYCKECKKDLRPGAESRVGKKQAAKGCSCKGRSNRRAGSRGTGTATATASREPGTDLAATEK